MYKYLRIAFCIIAVLLTAACIFIFIYAGLGWGFVCVAAAAACYMLMVYFKGKQEKQEGTASTAAPEGDFITGRIASVDAAERIAAINSAVTVENADGGVRTFILEKGGGDAFDKVGAQSALGKAVWHKKISDEVTYKDGGLNDVTLKIINIE